jgi:hypothetical protein
VIIKKILTKKKKKKKTESQIKKEKKKRKRSCTGHIDINNEVAFSFVFY